MTETTKQNSQSKLSFAEECDVLLPIYIWGQEKGWEFLSPEQVQKLVDGGRLRWTDLGYYEVIDFEKFGANKSDNAQLMVDMFMSTLVNAFEKALIEQLHYCPSEEWESKTQEEKWVVDKLVFYLTFNIILDELPDKLLAFYSGNATEDKIGIFTQ